MSRIGKKPVAVPSGVTASLDGRTVKAKGPKGELAFAVNDNMRVAFEDNQFTVEPANDTKEARQQWGMSRTMIENVMVGASTGFSKTLEINGVGYRATQQGRNVQLALGFSHDVVYEPPEGVDIKVTKPTEIVVSGHDKQKVGQAAAEIRGYKPPEPYKGKGIKYSDETIFRKEGKKK